jgi:osmotically-inducible protein OsmY
MTGIRGTIRVLHWDREHRGDAGIIVMTRGALETALCEEADELSLRARDGVVTIRGEVARLEDIQRFEAIVRSVPGVVDVDNLLRLRLGGRIRPRVLTA